MGEGARIAEDDDGGFGSKAHQEWNLTNGWCFWLQGLYGVAVD